MSHALNLQSMLERLVVLEHMALGSKEVCRKNDITSFEKAGYLKPLSIRTLTKDLICDGLINIAIKGRIIMEHVQAIDERALKRIEDEAVAGLKISYDTKGSKVLSLRESFNKIVHATAVSISFAESETDPENTHFWDGQVSLDGQHYDKEWSHYLVVDEWARAGRRLIEKLLLEDKLYMLGWDGGF